MYVRSLFSGLERRDSHIWVSPDGSGMYVGCDSLSRDRLSHNRGGIIRSRRRQRIWENHGYTLILTLFMSVQLWVSHDEQAFSLGWYLFMTFHSQLHIRLDSECFNHCLAIWQWQYESLHRCSLYLLFEPNHSSHSHNPASLELMFKWTGANYLLTQIWPHINIIGGGLSASWLVSAW